MTKNNSSDIDWERLKHIISQIISYAVFYNTKVKIGFVGSGEPLLRFDLIQKSIEYIKHTDTERLLSLYTISNGLNCSEELLKYLYLHKDLIKLSFSLDGNKDIHNACRKTKCGTGSFDNTMKAIELYTDIFGEAPALNTTVHKQTIKQANSILDFFSSKFNEVCFSMLFDEPDPEFMITEVEYKAFMASAKKTSLSLRQCKTPLKYDCTMYGQLCGVGRTNPYYSDGLIYPCGRFVGNAKYILGKEDISLFELDERIKAIQPCSDGLCYYNEHLIKTNI